MKSKSVKRFSQCNILRQNPLLLFVSPSVCLSAVRLPDCCRPSAQLRLSFRTSTRCCRLRFLATHNAQRTKYQRTFQVLAFLLFGLWVSSGGATSRDQGNRAQRLKQPPPERGQAQNPNPNSNPNPEPEHKTMCGPLSGLCLCLRTRC